MCRRELEGDQKQIAEYEIPEIDLVIVDLYPFEETVASGADESAIIEKIDIGGISLIRAAAKNFKDVVIVASKGQYAPLMQLLNEKGEFLNAAEGQEVLNIAAAEAFDFADVDHLLQFLIISITEKVLISVVPRTMPKYCVMAKILIRKVFSSGSLVKCSNNFMGKKFHITTYWI